MLHTIIKDNAYQDSVVLMLLTNKINTMDGVNRVSIMMGTPANKDIFSGSGLRTPELEKASANDMAIVLDTDNENVIDDVLKEIDEFLTTQATSEKAESNEAARTWEKAMKLDPNANIALLSIPGIYAAQEAERALDEGLHVFVFSDNVPVEDELRLKQKAHEKGLLVMGPDCGTGIINGVPMAFTNVVHPGNIGIVGASGTGIQEVSTIIDRLGGGVTNAIGTGGRDLSETVGGITMMDAIVALDQDSKTDVIVVISKPPAKVVRDKVLALLHTVKKPVVTIFLGEKPTYHEENLYHAYTLEETARIAVALSKGEEIISTETEIITPAVTLKPEQMYIKGYYSGGTLASEAGMLIADALALKEGLIKQDGYILKTEGHEIIDLGDDIYTQGKPHPMIDPEKRIEFIRQAANDSETAVILLDVVLGYGAHMDMASQLAPAIRDVHTKTRAEGREVVFIGIVCGTTSDPQGYDVQKNILEEAGVIVCESNNQAIRTALKLIGFEVIENIKEVRAHVINTEAPQIETSEVILDMLKVQPRVINVGLRSFAQAIKETGGKATQFDWRPIAGGNVKLQLVLDFLRNANIHNVSKI